MSAGRSRRRREHVVHPGRRDHDADLPPRRLTARAALVTAGCSGADRPGSPTLAPASAPGCSTAPAPRPRTTSYTWPDDLDLFDRRRTFVHPELVLVKAMRGPRVLHTFTGRVVPDADVRRGPRVGTERRLRRAHRGRLRRGPRLARPAGLALPGRAAAHLHHGPARRTPPPPCLRSTTRPTHRCATCRRRWPSLHRRAATAGGDAVIESWCSPQDVICSWAPAADTSTAPSTTSTSSWPWRTPPVRSTSGSARPSIPAGRRRSRRVLEKARREQGG